MDAADPQRALGIPCAFADYEVLGRDERHHVRAGIPDRHERICAHPEHEDNGTEQTSSGSEG
ncbi:MAG TPA: hypothetical protein VFN21_06935 [Acidimicrobiales bacterium]|nr:hypothetical protein [Acidimicrobiales bacterium]